MPEFVELDSSFLEELQPPEWSLTPAQRRRLKASLVLLSVWAFVTLLQLYPVTRWIAVLIAAWLSVHAFRLILSDFDPAPDPLQIPLTPDAEGDLPLPRVSILVPAKNESAVLPTLIQSLAQLNYPSSHLQLWVIDDASTDATPEVLSQLQSQIPHLRLHRRPEGAGGGKSGALNEVMPLTQGEIILVCDADALVSPDLLRRALPLFLTHDPQKRPVGAVQLRKAIANADQNFWTRGQRCEMAADSYFQLQRTAVEGIGELRGNGQLVRRDVLEKCGGWNEATLTDDLDLTLKLHLAGVDIAFLAEPAIQEEGVTRWKNLWHQRSRWAEGGYQRYLDYWPWILSDLGVAKSLDLVNFFIIQYLVPMALIPDMLWGIFLTHHSVLWPISAVMVSMSIFALWGGLQHIHALKGWHLWKSTLLGLIYMMHWFPVMIFTTARMCVQPKRLKWIKTVHQGGAHS